MTKQAIAYGRKSFDDPQNRTSSIADQGLFAAGYAKQHGFELVHYYSDEGITGATMERRPGLQAMLEAMKADNIRILIIEDVDRLSRDSEHIQYMVKLFRVYNITLHTVATGPIDELILSFKGIIGEEQRSRIRYTTKRGLKGKARRGGSTGGKTLGYRRELTGNDAEGRPTDRLAINDDEASLVRRIFTLYDEGLSLKKICNVLNEDGIPSPRAREKGKYNAGIWNPSTLSGDPAKGEGILNNQIYIGVRIFDRRKWIEVPTENRGFRRQPRLNAAEEWDVIECPELRIIDQELWDRVKVRQAEARAARDAKFKLTGNPLAGAKRPEHLLSGLVRCGVCGEPYVSTGGRWRCKAALRKSCSNGSIPGDQLEARALTGLRDRLLTPEVVGRFAVHLQRELDAQQRAAYGRRDEIEASLSDTRTRGAKILKRIEEDDDAPRALSARLKELEAEETRLIDELANLPKRTVVRLPANYEAVYRSAIAELEAHLASREASASREAIRTLIEAVVVHAGDARGGKVRRLELHGDLYRMLEFAEGAVTGGVHKRPKLQPFGAGALVGTPLVAGVGFEPTTFRL